MKEFFHNIDWYTWTSAILTIISATATFLLDKASEKDGRKKFLGIFRKDLKRYSSYLTLILTMLTLILGDKNKVDEKLEDIANKQNDEGRRQKGVDITLQEIHKTLLKQDSTLKKQDSMLKFEDSTLKIQNKTLYLQGTTIRRSAEILKNQVQTLDDLGKTLVQNNSIMAKQNEQFATLRKVLLNIDDINGATIDMTYSQEVDSQNTNFYDNISKNLYFANISFDQESFKKTIAKLDEDSLTHERFNSYDVDVRGKLNKIITLSDDFLVFEMFVLNKTSNTMNTIHKMISAVDSASWVHSDPDSFIKGYDINPVDSIPYQLRLRFDMQTNDAQFFYLGVPIQSKSLMAMQVKLKASIKDSKTSLTFDDLKDSLILIRIKPPNLGFRIEHLDFTKGHKSINIQSLRFIRERWGRSYVTGAEREQYYLLQLGGLEYSAN